MKTLTVREKDVVFRCPDPAPILERLREAKGQVTALAPKSHDTMHEVYYRPPEQYLEPETLGNVLRRRLAGAATVGTLESRSAPLPTRR